MDTPRFEDALELHRAGDARRAAELYAAILDADPSHVNALYHLALIFRDGGDARQAIECLTRCLAVDDELAAPHDLLGVVLTGEGRLDEADRHLRRAVALKPASAQSHNNLGNALEQRGDRDGAIACYRRALDLDAAYADAHFNLGMALRRRGEELEAVAALQSALRLAPDDAEGALHLANALSALGRFAESVPAFERALALEPSQADAHYELGLGRFQLGEIGDALRSFRRAAELGSEEALESIAVVIPGDPGSDHAAVLAARRAWVRGQQVGPVEPHRAPADAAARKLRVGYVSSFFQDANWMKPVWAALRHHDRDALELHVFSDAARERVPEGHRPHPSDIYHDISGQRNEDVARRIREAGIDVLVDLNGYSHVPRLRLFLHRPSPVQVSWFNMYATTGMPCFDALIGDEHVVREDEERFYTEPIVRLPSCYLTFEVDHPAPEVAPPPCVRRGFLTFGSLASQYKLSPPLVAAWSRILQGAPESRLLLRNRGLGDAGAHEHLKARFAEHGVDPVRLELLGPAEHFEFLRSYDRIDVALDSFPYNGGTTTCEALWQGVPVLAFCGDRWGARYGWSILQHAGLSEFGADDEEGLVALAVDLARAPETASRLSALRSTLRDRLRGASICDSARLARLLEGEYRRLWHAWRDQEAAGRSR